MGMAASQARLLSITARIHDVEYQAQQIQSRKLQLATLEDEAYRKYNDALDATTLTFTNDQGNLIPANFNNLCGKSSISNGMNKYYAFRTGDDDRLIVPNEIYDGYKSFDGEDPYAFAMYMLGVDGDALAQAENDYFSQDSVADANSSAREPLREIAKQVATLTGQASPEEFAKEVVDDDPGGGGSRIDDVIPPRDDPNYQEVMDLVKEFHEEERKYRTSLYNRGGSEKIYNLATGNDDFDSDAYQYYLRWGMMIEQEVDIDCCVRESDYGDDFGSDQEMLNSMLQSGRIIVDSIEVKNGKLNDETATVGADSRLAYTPTTTIDKKALAKAEAEYEHTMKEIDRKDKRYDMDLNKLETERTALTTEYDSVKKVIQDNIERTFKIFS